MRKVVQYVLGDPHPSFNHVMSVISVVVVVWGEGEREGTEALNCLEVMHISSAHWSELIIWPWCKCRKVRKYRGTKQVFGTLPQSNCCSYHFPAIPRFQATIIFAWNTAIVLWLIFLLLTCPHVIYSFFHYCCLLPSVLQVTAEITLLNIKIDGVTVSPQILESLTPIMASWTLHCLGPVYFSDLLFYCSSPGIGHTGLLFSTPTSILLKVFTLVVPSA